jgi:hypothetical protein
MGLNRISGAKISLSDSLISVPDLNNKPKLYLGSKSYDVIAKSLSVCCFQLKNASKLGPAEMYKYLNENLYDIGIEI